MICIFRRGCCWGGWAGGIALYMTQVRGAGIASAAGVVTAYLFVKLVIMLLTAVLQVRVAGISFGTWAPAALKMTATAIVPDVVGLATVTILGTCLGLLVALGVGFATLWIMFSYLFELDSAEAGLCAVLYCMIGVGFLAAWWRLFAWLMTVAPQ